MKEENAPSEDNLPTFGQKKIAIQGSKTGVSSYTAMLKPTARTSGSQTLDSLRVSYLKTIAVKLHVVNTSCSTHTN